MSMIFFAFNVNEKKTNKHVILIHWIHFTLNKLWTLILKTDFAWTEIYKFIHTDSCYLIGRSICGSGHLVHKRVLIHIKNVALHFNILTSLIPVLFHSVSQFTATTTKKREKKLYMLILSLIPTKNTFKKRQAMQSE